MGSRCFDEPVVVKPQTVSKRVRECPENAAELAAEADPRGAVEVNPHVPPLYEAAGSRELRMSCNYMIVQGDYAGETPRLLELKNVKGVLMWKCQKQSINILTGHVPEHVPWTKSFFRRYSEALRVARAASGSAGAQDEEEGAGETEEAEEDVIASDGRKRRKPRGGKRGVLKVTERLLGMEDDRIITISLPRSPEDDGAHG